MALASGFPVTSAGEPGTQCICSQPHSAKRKPGYKMITVHTAKFPECRGGRRRWERRGKVCGTLCWLEDGQCLASRGWKEYSGEAARGTVSREDSTKV